MLPCLSACANWLAAITASLTVIATAVGTSHHALAAASKLKAGTGLQGTRRPPPAPF